MRFAVAALLILALVGGCGGGRDSSHKPKRGPEALAAMTTAPTPSPQDSALLRKLRTKRRPATIDQYMTAVLDSVDEYWTRSYKEIGRPDPRVFYVWIPAGVSTSSECGPSAADTAAFYCPADDTIYVGEPFAYGLYAGALHGLPGELATGARPYGDFAVAYVIAHEYAHNVQNELGIFKANPTKTAKPFELQADCMAGTWARSVFDEGLADPGDLDEAVTTAVAVGDFELNDPQHHGTPKERYDAFLTGYNGGKPASCAHFVPAKRT